MKLIICHSCQDVFKFGRKIFKSCRCGKVKARYINDLDGEFYSQDDGYTLVGFANSSLSSSIMEYKEIEREEGFRENSWGLPFDAFIIPEPCSSIKRVDLDNFNHISNQMIENLVIEMVGHVSGASNVTLETTLRQELNLDNVDIISILRAIESNINIELINIDIKPMLRKIRKVKNLSILVMRAIE